MDEQLLASLADELQKEFNDLENLEAGSNEYASHVNNIEKLWKLAQKEVEMAKEDEETAYRREQEAVKAVIEAKDKKIDRAITIGTKVIEISIPTAVYVALFHKGLKFEETGVVSSGPMRNLMNKMPWVKR